MTRIVLIGPIEPFRGGIAHSSTILAKNLAKENDLFVLSFKSLYPSILYPGKFQRAKGKTPKNIRTEFVLDSLNPLSWIKAVKKIKEFQAETVVFEWWTTFLTPCYAFIASRLKHETKSVVCQNVFPHEESKINKMLTKIFLKKADNLVALSRSDEKILKSLKLKGKTTRIIEPTYDSLIEMKKIPKSQARKKLKIKHKKVILFFGFVREYKGLGFLIKAMSQVLKKHDALLLIVGEFWESKEKYERMIETAGIEKNVLIENRYIENREVSLYFNASDVLALPYTSSTESGIIQLAFGYQKPVITTKIGGNSDFIENEKNGLLVKPFNSNELASAINKFYDKKLEQKFIKEMKKKKKIFKWNKEKENAVLGKI